MLPPVRRSAPLVLCLLLAACGTKGGSGGGSGGPVDPNTVVVNEAMISLGGERLGPSPEDKLFKNSELFDKLKEKRETWKMEHPEGKFPGALTVELGPSMTCLASFSVLQSAAFAGYPNFTIKQGTTTLEVPADIPKLPEPTEVLAKDPPQKVYVRFLPEGDVEIRKGRCGGAYDVVPAASVAATVKEICGDRGDCLRGFHVGCEPGTPMSKILPILAEVRAASKKMEIGARGGLCKPGEGPYTDWRSWLMLLGEIPFSAGDDAPRPPLPVGVKVPGSQLKELEVTVSGGAFADEVRAAMKPKMADFKLCYSRGLLRNPNLQGRVVVKLEIGKKGAVMAVSKGPQSDVVDNDVTECILEAASTISLPGKGSIGTVSYSLAMSPK